MLAHRIRATVALLLSCLYLTNAGDFDANCQFSTEWIKHQSDWTSTVWADLSECQQDTLGVPQNKITLGGKGGSSTIGIDLGSGGDGCDGGTDCMEMCQALCCATKDCDIAMVHKDTEKECEVSCDIYKEEVDYFKCYMYKSGSQKSKSSVTSSCYTDPNAPNYNNCLTIAQNSDWGWDKATFDYIKGLQTCSNRRLLANVKVDKYPSKREIKRSIKRQIEESSGGFRANLKKAVKKSGGKTAFLKKVGKMFRRTPGV